MKEAKTYMVWDSSREEDLAEDNFYEILSGYIFQAKDDEHAVQVISENELLDKIHGETEPSIHDIRVVELGKPLRLAFRLV